MKIYLVVDTLNWVQHYKAQILKKNINEFDFEIITPKEIERKIKKNFILIHFYFFSWKLLNNLNYKKLNFLTKCSSIGVTSHYLIGGGLDENSCFPLNSNKKKILKKTLNILKKFKLITVNSIILKNHLKKNFNIESKVFCIQNGVDTNLFSKNQVTNFNKPKIIGWSGKIKAAKNIDLLDKIQSKLDNKKFKFVKKVSERNKRFSILDFFKKKNNFNLVEQKKFYDKLDFYICTSSHEGTPNPCLEAMASGKPVISTKVGNVPEIVKNTKYGFLVNNNVESFLNAFDKIEKMKKKDYLIMSKKIIFKLKKNWCQSRFVDEYKIYFNKVKKSKLYK